MNAFAHFPVTKYEFGEYDELVIGTVSYRPLSRTTEGYVLVREDGSGVAEAYPHEHLSQLVKRGKVRHVRGRYLPEEAPRSMRTSADLLSTLTGPDTEQLSVRIAFVDSFRALENEGAVKRTDASINACMDEICRRAARMMQDRNRSERKPYAGARLESVVPPSARTLRRWLTAFEKGGLAGLAGNRRNSGNRGPRIGQEETALMMSQVQGYASPQSPTQQMIFDDVRRAFADENKLRMQYGRPALVCPSRQTIRQEIAKLDPFATDIKRIGIEKAQRKHAPVGQGITSSLTRPLERVEMDEWRIDLMTLLASSGLLPLLQQEDLVWQGLDGSKDRWWLCVAMCVTTKCILGMRLTRGTTASAARSTLRMNTQDKGCWADAVGAATPWSMHGIPEHLVTDGGSAFIAADFLSAVHDLGIISERAISGMPQLRGSIERVFRTFGTNLLPRLTGRTFSDMIERGHYPSQEAAALTVEDLSHALVRWVVDVYHNTPHAGLGGETPVQCWHRLTQTKFVSPPPDLRTQRAIFGQKLTRTVTREGITVLNVRYHSDVLAQWFLRSRKREVNLRWLEDDVGAIEVELDGDWQNIPAVFDRFEGCSAQTLVAAARELRASRKTDQHFSEEIVFEAIRSIEQRNAKAMARADISITDWSEERIMFEEERLMSGFQVRPNQPELEKAWDGMGSILQPWPGSIEAADPSQIDPEVQDKARYGTANPSSDGNETDWEII